MCTNIKFVIKQYLNVSPRRQRPMILFEESIKSKYTKQNYISNLNQFKKFSMIHSIDELLTIPKSELQYLIENYLLKLKHTTNPNSIPSKFKGIKHFCVMNEIDLNWNIIYKMFPQKQKTQNLRSYTTIEIRKLLSNITCPRDEALIHFFISTGARVGVFDHDLSVKHMKKMSNGCNAVLLYAGHIDEYWAFLTPQASLILKKYHRIRKQRGEIFNEHTPLFITYRKNPQPIGWSGVRSVVYRTISKSNMIRIKHNGRYDVQADHGFRKRFNTILKLNNFVNYNIAEKLMGHRNGLDGIYLKPTLDEIFKEFKKVMTKLEV